MKNEEWAAHSLRLSYSSFFILHSSLFILHSSFIPLLFGGSFRRECQPE